MERFEYTLRDEHADFKLEFSAPKLDPEARQLAEGILQVVSFIVAGATQLVQPEHQQAYLRAAFQMTVAAGTELAPVLQVLGLKELAETTPQGEFDPSSVFGDGVI